MSMIYKNLRCTCILWYLQESFSFFSNVMWSPKPSTIIILYKTRYSLKWWVIKHKNNCCSNIYFPNMLLYRCYMLNMHQWLFIIAPPTISELVLGNYPTVLHWKRTVECVSRTGNANTGDACRVPCGGSGLAGMDVDAICKEIDLWDLSQNGPMGRFAFFFSSFSLA